jgi:hypothetical protein
MRDARGLKRAERGLANREDLQRCAVCGRWFIRRRGTVCSRTCLERVAPSDTPPDHAAASRMLP